MRDEGWGEGWGGGVLTVTDQWTTTVTCLAQSHSHNSTHTTPVGMANALAGANELLCCGEKRQGGWGSGVGPHFGHHRCH